MRTSGSAPPRTSRQRSSRWRAGSSGTAAARSRAPAAGGITDIIPLISKGRSDIDNDNTQNVNYILGIDQSSQQLVADFEEDDGGPNHMGLNHPVHRE